MAKRKPVNAAVEKLKEYLGWVMELSPLDLKNFTTLISLSNSRAVIEKMPKGQYQDMALFALAMKDQSERTTLSNEREDDATLQPQRQDDCV